MNRNTSNETTPKSALEAIRDNIYLKTAAITLAGGALTACATNTEAPRSQAETVTTEVTPVPEATLTPTPEVETPVSDKVEIPAGLENQEAGKVVMDRLDDWVNAGASDDLKTEVVGVGWDNLLKQVSEANTAKYAPALFINGWEDDPDLANFATNITSSNLGTLQWYAKTAWSGDEANQEGYKNWFETLGVNEVSNDGTNRTLTIQYQNNSNFDKNLGPDASIDKGVVTVSLKEVDGSDKISAINFDVQP